MGSPPYTWGAPNPNDIRVVNIGITPIYMGSTTNYPKWFACLKDHPHIHGEHTRFNLAIRCLAGSPPYTWGAHENIEEYVETPGITPIYMGSTIRFWSLGSVTRDHPHIHGEHCAFSSLVISL